MKKTTALIMCLTLLCVILCGCGNDYEIVAGHFTSVSNTSSDSKTSDSDVASTETTTTTEATETTTTAETTTTTVTTTEATKENKDGTYYKDTFYSNTEYKYPDREIKKYDISKVSAKSTPAKDKAQLEKPKKGEEIAVMVTSMGTITIRFFDEQSPLAVTNFKELVKQHYYDGMIWHRVMNNFMIQGGDPTATGRGGQSVYGNTFADEYNNNLYNFRGAVSMANAGGGSSTNGSQFFINQCPNCGYDAETLAGYGWPAWAAEVYEKLGGYPSLDNVHTVFGQVVEGMDVVDKIAAVKTDDNDKPVNNVYIYEVTLEKYKG